MPTNACTTPLALEQVITVILFLLQLALHSIFIIPPLDDISHVLLWILLGFHYILLLAIIYDYIYLSATDPVDPLVLDQEMMTRYRPE